MTDEPAADDRDPALSGTSDAPGERRPGEPGEADGRGGEIRRSTAGTITGLALVVLLAGLGFWLFTKWRDDGSVGRGEPTESGGRSRLAGFDEVSITVTGPDGEDTEACLLLAQTSSQRQRGLMEVTDPSLGGYDGMLFDYGEVLSSSGFWMRNTPMPLSIAFFEGGGELVSTADMDPCSDRPSCPVYAAGGLYQYAIEVPRGRLRTLGIESGATLAVGARSCPPA